MTDYTDHPDAIFEPRKPILGSTAVQSRDNLVAVAEGAPGAPKVNGLALNMHLGSWSATGTGTIVAISGLEAAGKLMVSAYAESVGGPGSDVIVLYRTSTDGGTTESDSAVITRTGASSSSVDPQRSVGSRLAVVDVSGGVNYVRFTVEVDGVPTIGAVELDVFTIARDGA